uniref:Polyadenylate-binding protein 1-like protein n=1 Tax=Triatoma infestans TaxID=30076 RepID=A0A161MHY1_TRIIF
MLKRQNPEEVEPAGPSDRQCCVCYDNKATRIVIPCGHQCLCYHCAKSIAFSRTTLASVRIPKRCPLCQAAIAAMMRPLIKKKIYIYLSFVC